MASRSLNLEAVISPCTWYATYMRCRNEALCLHRLCRPHCGGGQQVRLLWSLSGTLSTLIYLLIQARVDQLIGVPGSREVGNSVSTIDTWTT